MKKFLLSLLSLLFCVALYAEENLDVQKVCDQLLESGSEIASGETPATGLWIVAIGRVDANAYNHEKDAKTKASLEAKKVIASFLGTRVASASEMSMQETETNTSSSFSQWTRVDVKQALAGVRIERVTEQDGAWIACAVMTEKTADATTRLKDTIAKQDRPNTVEASGFGRTKDEAVEAACRSALEQVCGASIVASDLATENNAVRSRTYTDVQGFVSAYRILRENVSNEQYHVVILAEIDKEALQESYGAQMQSMGDPIFCITSNNTDAAIEAADYLMEKGLKTSVQSAGADYKVVFQATFTPTTHPTDQKRGTQLQLTALCYDKTGILMFSLQNDPRKATVFVGNLVRQKQLCVKRAIKQLGKPLHERLQRAISDMVNNGRKVRLVFRNVRTKADCELVEHITEAINEMPIASSATYSLNEAVQVSTIRLTLKGNPQDFVALLRETIESCPEALSITANKIVFEL